MIRMSVRFCFGITMAAPVAAPMALADPSVLRGRVVPLDGATCGFVQARLENPAG